MRVHVCASLSYNRAVSRQFTVAAALGMCVLLASACSRPSSFECASADECPEGRCEASGFCSVSVATEVCPSGLRYRSSAGPLADQCVEVAEVVSVVDFEDLPYDESTILDEYAGIDFAGAWTYVPDFSAPTAGCAFADQTNRGELTFVGNTRRLLSILVWSSLSGEQDGVTLTFRDLTPGSANPDRTVTVGRGMSDTLQFDWAEATERVAIESTDTWNFVLDNITLADAP